MGAAVGRAYASNTFGTIVGSFLAGFVLIPAVGMQEAIAVAVAVFRLNRKPGSDNHVLN